MFFSSSYVTLLSTTGYKVLKYSSRIHMVYLAVQQQNKLIQFPVCANVGVLFTLAKSRASKICWWKATNQNIEIEIETLINTPKKKGFSVPIYKYKFKLYLTS